jgi:glutamate/tyrosine decarboxylase-like PLP-dependent enzyme
MKINIYKNRILIFLLFACAYYYKKYKKNILFFIYKNTTSGKKYLKSKKKEALLTIKDKLFSKKYTYNFDVLPNNSIHEDDIKNILINRKSKVGNKISGCVYSNNKDCERLVSYISNEYLYSNPLHPDIYPELIKMESEIIKMIGSLYNLPASGGGNLTTGGTESTILALKAYKKLKKKYLPFFTPEVLCTKTVHAAVNKACELLDLNIVYVNLDENNVMDVVDLENKISFKTCVIIGSAPCFAYGLMDPLADISYIAETYNIPFHVDACLGGFLTQFDTNLKFTFDLNIQSISVDPHKFGYAPKGSSILLWKNKIMKRNQYFIVSDWTGGIYASVSLPGSRVGSQIATTWGSILYNGYQCYESIAKKIISKTIYLKHEIEKIDTFKVIGNPNVNVVAFYSTNYNVSQLIDYLSKHEWNLNILQNPLCIHICITPKNINSIENLIDLLKNILNEKIDESSSNIASIYGISAKIPDKSIIDEIVESYLDLTTSI